MVKNCYLCRRSSEKEFTRSYHVFPRNPVLRNVWFIRIGMEYVDTACIYLCSDHFACEDFYVQPSGRRVLRKNAAPVTIKSSASSEDEVNTLSSNSSSCVTSPHENVTMEVDPLKIEPEEFVDPTSILNPLSSSPSSTKTGSKISEFVGKDYAFVNLSTKRFTEVTINQVSKLSSVYDQRKIREKWNNIRYLGDITSADWSTPRSRRRNWDIAKETIESQKKKIENLKQTKMRLQAKLVILKTQLKYFRKMQKKENVKFPKEPSLRSEWFRKLGLKPVKTRSIYLCSDHFTSEQFTVRPNGRQILRKGAIPHIKSPERTEEDDAAVKHLPESSFTVSSDLILEVTSNSLSNSSRASSLSSSSGEYIYLQVESSSSELKETTDHGSLLETPLSLSTSVTETASEVSEIDSEIEGPTVFRIIKSEHDKVSSTPSQWNSSKQPQTNNKTELSNFKSEKYIGDVNSEDISTARRKRKWALTLKKIESQKKTIRGLQQANRRLTASIARVKNQLKIVKP